MGYCVQVTLGNETLSYELVDNILTFSYNETDYIIEFACKGIERCSSVDLKHTIFKSGIDGYKLTLSCSSDGKDINFTVVYFFNSIDLVKNTPVRLRVEITRSSSDFMSECSVHMTPGKPAWSTDGVRLEYLSMAERFNAFGTLSQMMEHFEFEMLDYIEVGRKLLIKIENSYLVLDDTFFDIYYEIYKDSFRCYRCKYNNYEFYMFATSTSATYRVIIKDSNVVTGNLNVLILNNRLV